MILDYVIYLLLVYIATQLGTCFFLEHVITMSVLVGLKKYFIVLAALIIIDLIYDLIKAAKEGYKEVKKDFIRLIIILIFSVLVVCSNSYLLNKADPYKANVSNNILNKIDEENYVSISEKANILEKNIYDTYGIKVYTNINPNTLFKDAHYNYYIDENDAPYFERYLEVIYEELKVYSKEALALMPKCMFIVSNDIEEDSETSVAGVNYNRTSPANNFVVFCALDNIADHARVVVHHEIFHTLNVYTDENILKEFEENKESCSLTSEYACTNPVEFIAESWCYKLVENLNTEHSAILSKTFDKFLKDFEQEGIILSAYDDYLELPSKVSDTLIVNNFDADSFKSLTSTSTNYLLDENYRFINKNDKALIYKGYSIFYGDLKERFEKKSEEIMNSFNSQGILKVLDIYKYLINDLEEDEELENELWYYVHKYYGAEKFSHHEIENAYLYNILLKLDYEAYLNYDLESGFYITMNYNDKTYFFDTKLEYIDRGLYQGFMLCQEDFRFYYPDVEALYYFDYENDRSYSDYDSILLLDEFDAAKIDKFFISALKKYKLKTKLYIVCKDENICDEVENYMKFKSGKSLIQTTYNRYIDNNYYPGYWYVVGDEYIAIFDLY